MSIRFYGKAGVAVGGSATVKTVINCVVNDVRCAYFVTTVLSHSA